MAEYVNVCERPHKPTFVTLPAVQVTGVTAPHSLEAVTVVLQIGGVGLQPNGPPVGKPANTGAVAIVQV